MREPLMSPRRIRASVFDRDPRHRLVVPPRRVIAVLPRSQEVVIVLWMIVGGIYEFLEFGIRYRRPIDIKRVQVHSMAMKSTCVRFPWILHIYSRIVSPLYFNATHLKVIIALGNAYHSVWRRLRRS